MSQSTAERHKKSIIGVPYFQDRPALIQQERRQGPKFRTTVLVMLLLAAVGISYTYQQNTAIKLGYQINKLDQQIADLHMRNTEAEMQIVQLQSPQRIETLARNKMGMQAPKNLFLVSAAQVQPMAQSHRL
jgi:cell division protein FtsL